MVRYFKKNVAQNTPENSPRRSLWERIYLKATWRSLIYENYESMNTPISAFSNASRSVIGQNSVHYSLLANQRTFKKIIEDYGLKGRMTTNHHTCVSVFISLTFAQHALTVSYLRINCE